MDDYDLDDAALWAVIDSAAAAASRRFRSPALLPAPKTSHIPHRNPLRRPPPDDETRPFAADGEVLQPEEAWVTHHRRPPHKAARLAAHAPPAVVVQHPPSPSPPPAYGPPEMGRRMVVVKEASPMVVESPSPESWKVEGKGKEVAGHSLLGQFPSVATFKQYQEMAMAILEKSDYALISGNPYIKKSGWRKISCFFSVSFEIKDKSIEFDEHQNVQRAEFVVRAYVQGGRFSDGWGSCERREKRFNKPNHDIPSTAETRAKNKACQDLLGIGHNRPG